MTGCRLDDARLADGCLDGPLKHVFAQVMPPDFRGARIFRPAGGGEYILPSPLSSGVGVFSLEGVRQIHVAISFPQVLVVDQLHLCKVVLQGLHDAAGQYGHAIFLSLAPTSHNI